MARAYSKRKTVVEKTVIPVTLHGFRDDGTEISVETVVPIVVENEEQTPRNFGRIAEPDWETTELQQAKAFLARMHEIYRRGAEVIDRRSAATSKRACSVCGYDFPEGRWRSEKAFPEPSDPMRFQVFRMCSDRCDIIFNQNVSHFRESDKGALARIRQDYFPSRRAAKNAVKDVD